MNAICHLIKHFLAGTNIQTRSYAKKILRKVELNCFVYGDTPAVERIFPIVIARSRTVGTLKNLIKERKHPEFAHIAADRLILWNVSIPLDKNADNALKQLVLRDQKKLFPTKRLSSYFPDEPAKEHIHVVIQPPSGNKMQCF